MSDELAVQQVLARYSRAHDRRDGAAMGATVTNGNHGDTPPQCPCLHRVR